MTQIVDSQRDVNLSMLDLQNLDFMGHHKWENLSEINVSRNMLSNIDILTMYQNLTQIDASRNYIKSVDLNLPRLKFLYLSQNQMTKFPEIVPSKKIRTLDLSDNFIESLESISLKE